MANTTSPHILNTSANLLGFCLFVITALHVADRNALSIIDELTSVVAVLLAVCTALSFLSIKTQNLKLERKLEAIADYLFMISLIGIIVVIILIALSFIS